MINFFIKQQLFLLRLGLFGIAIAAGSACGYILAKYRYSDGYNNGAALGVGLISVVSILCFTLTFLIPLKNKKETTYER